MPSETVISKLRKNKIITKDNEDFLLGCKIVRNSLHNNGYHKTTSTTVRMLGKEFDVNEKSPIDFMDLQFTIECANEMIKIFKEITLETDWKNIQDITTLDR
jgi:hypothetical protein